MIHRLIRRPDLTHVELASGNQQDRFIAARMDSDHTL